MTKPLTSHRPVLAILLKVAAIGLFTVLSALIKAATEEVPAGGGVLSLLLCHPCHRCLAGPARGSAGRAENQEPDGTCLAGSGGDLGHGDDLSGSWPLAPARGDGHRLWHADFHTHPRRALSG